MMDSPQISRLRVDYQSRTLSERDVAASPIEQFGRWLNEAIEAKANEPNAMTLATVEAGRPDARIVLLKQFDERGLVFFTNYASRKGQQLTAEPRAALVFWWPELERQVRISGSADKVSDAESQAYFEQRPRKSQIGAAASEQSQVIASREFLEARFHELDNKYADASIPRPASWGGYRLTPDYFEFWQGRRSRLHDRIAYTRQNNGSWNIARLSP